MTKSQQDSTIKKIEREVEKLLPKPEDGDFAIGGYDDKMGDNNRDLESIFGEEGDENQGDENGGERNRG